MITEKELHALTVNDLESLLNRSKKQLHELMDLVLTINVILNNKNTEALTHKKAPYFEKDA